MNKNVKMIGAAAMMAAAVSCTRMTPCGNDYMPTVNLEQNNYRVIAAQVSAEDAGFELFSGIQVFTSTFGPMIPFVDASKLPTGLTVKSPSEMKALQELYRRSGAINPGRATQLVNIRKETGYTNLILFGRPRVRITADLVEFVK